jgi:phosphatidylglycerol---prolipoprotein diacylglyceryl transferase
MLTTLAYYLHDLNPIIFELGPIKPRWYGLSYLMGFLGAYILIRKLARDGMLRLAPDKVADMVLNSCIFGVLIGGRLGYVLFYDLPNALKEHATPLLWQFTDAFPYWGVLRVMDGGMSAHGGILFSILTLAWFAHRYKASLVNILDAAAMVVPIGLCFGRIANFINGELYGHITSVPWAVKFPSEIWAPTNGAREIPPEQLANMKFAVGEYLGDHWQDLTARQVQDFLANHPEFNKILSEQFGALHLESAAQLDAVKHWLGDQLGQNPTNILNWDLARWWEHSSGSFHQFLHSQFDVILHPRHPSQLYEALLEGVLLFIIVWTIGRLWRKDGMAGGAFAVGYPLMRIIGEQFRVGDTPTHILGVTISYGVIYSLAMLIPGAIYWLYWIKRNRRIPWAPAAPAAAPPTQV